MTNVEFNIAFKPFLDYFPITEMTKDKLNLYCLALSDLTVDQLNNAFISMVKNRVYKNFPQIAEIIQYATGTTENNLEDRVVIAKQLFKNAIIKYGSYSSIEFEDKGIHAVVDALNGWSKVCSMSITELDKFLSFEFGKIYKAYARNNYKVSKFYIGVHDATNNTSNINKIGYNSITMKKLEENTNQKIQLEFQGIKKMSEMTEKYIID